MAVFTINIITTYKLNAKVENKRVVVGLTVIPAQIGNLISSVILI